MPTPPLKLLFISKLKQSHRMLADSRLSRHLASQLGPAITVNTLALGPFRSKMMAATLDAFEKDIAGSLPMQRIGKGEDVAGACLWLSSKAGEWVTG
jgi:NAD(P)-dependent dehydrogenase (short-subunit alcohol dehydrogenase family)